MCLQPVCSDSHVHFQWYIKNIRTFHFGFYQNLDLLQLGLVNIEHQFIMHLQQHFCFIVALSQLSVDVDHRQLDNVCSASLNRRVDGIPFGCTSNYCVLGVDIAQVAATS